MFVLAYVDLDGNIKLSIVSIVLLELHSTCNTVI